MKKSLLQSLALVGLVLSFTACNPTVDPSSSLDDQPTLMTISQATEWDTEAGAPVNDGKLVTITEAALNNKYGNGIIVQQTEGTTLSGIYCVEVLTKQPVSFGWKDLLKITGKVGQIDGRPVIKDATVQYSVDEATSKGKGSIYGLGTLSRATFDAFASRSSSGLLSWGASVQLATLPGTVVAGTASEFKVVFPGEKVESDNPIAIPVVIPALTEAEATAVNGFFADIYGGEEGTTPTPASIGDAFDLCAPMYWIEDTVGFVFGPYAVNLSEGFTEIEGLYDDWADIVEIPEIIASPLPDLGKTGTSIYSFVVNETYLEVADGFASGLLITAYTDDADADFTILKERILADTQLNWQIAATDEGYVGIEGSTIPVGEEESEVVSIVELENAGMYINIWLSGVAVTHDWASALAGWEAIASADTGTEFVSALPVYNDPLATDFASSADYYEAYGVFIVDVSTPLSSTYDYAEDLIAAGFVETEDGEDIIYINEESNEGVYIEDVRADYGIIELQFFLLA